MAYSRWSTIGQFQPNGQQEKVLPGIYHGFTVGTKSTGSVEAMLNAWDTFMGDYTESTAWGLPNQMGAPNLAPLQGCTRFVVFTAPMVPHYAHSGDTVGSLTALLRGDYDAKIDATAQAVVAAGFGTNSAIRSGHEYNAGAGKPDTDGFEWATNRRDPISGQINGIGQYLKGAAYTEGRWRAAGYTGFFSWCGGNGDTSALTVANAIPTHGDPKLTVWDWDIYPGPPYGGTKNNIKQFTDAAASQWAAYYAYAKAHNILLATTEYGQIYDPHSPFRYNDTDKWFPWLYDQYTSMADRVAWCIGYFQNQDYVSPGGTPAVLSESHALALSVPSANGSPMGQPATTPYVGDWVPGATGYLNSSGKIATGTANTLANTGSLQHSSDLGLYWKWNTDPSKALAVSSYRASFGGIGGAAGKGAAGMRKTADQPSVPGQTASAPLVISRNHRGQAFIYA